MCALYYPALNGGKASDWLRPVPCQQEGDKLPKGQHQSGKRYSTRVHRPKHLACDPSSWREASHVSSQGKEAVFVTHDIYFVHLQDHLLSCQLRPTFPPGWKEDGAIWLQASIII